MVIKPKLIVYDFDGVLTDNRVWLNQDGIESVACNRSDGWWIKEMSKLGIEQIILSTETNPVVSARAKKLNLEVHQGQSDKKSALEKILNQKKIATNQIIYVGNDLNDLGCFEISGTTLCPEDAHPEIKKIATKVLSVKGGFGVVPAVFDFLHSKKEEQPSWSTSGSHNELQNIQTTIQASIDTKSLLIKDNLTLSLIEEMGIACQKSLLAGGKILFAGNGGSFADSMHLSAEFVSKLQYDRIPLASVALGCSNSCLTAIGNDYGYEHSFSREVRAIGKKEDVFIAISTSGNSQNILAAVEAAKKIGMKIYGWSGKSGGKLAELCPTLKVPSTQTARIQECHIMIGHILCEIAEKPFLT